VTLAVVIAVLGVVGLAGAAVTTGQGPRVSSTSSDPKAAVAASGSRLIVAMNQSLRKVEAEQVTVTPATPFTVDTSGRSMGVRFTLPLHDDTEYTVRFRDVVGIGGGPAADVVERFRTPRLRVLVMQRGQDGDRILSTDVRGGDREPVLTDAHIEDFRATPEHIVVQTLDSRGRARLTVTRPDGTHRRALPLPGSGQIAQLQIADRGDLAGYTYTDADPGAAGAQISALYVASLKDAAARTPPRRIPLPGSDTRVADWRFVPDSDSILVMTFDGRMLLTGANGDKPVDLGRGLAIDGIARGSSTAVIERADGVFTVDLADGKQKPLPPATEAGAAVPGQAGPVVPAPGDDGTTIRYYAVLHVAGAAGADSGAPEGTTVFRVDRAGKSLPVLQLPAADAVLQTCVSPSARYVAVTVAPDTVNNPYDQYQLPMPLRTLTHIVDLTEGREVSQVHGFAPSWCQEPPALTG
jgi:hypothetical protein